MKLWQLLTLVGLALVGLGFIQYYRAAAGKERLARINLEAAADSTRHWYEDTLQVATRLAVQMKIKLDRGVVKDGRVVSVVTVVQPAETITVFKEGTVRGDTLHSKLDSAGVSVTAMVVPPAAWIWTIRRDPVALQVALSCEKGGRARATVTGPRWATLDIADPKQEPGICNPAPKWSPLSLRPPSFLWLGAAVVGGFFLGRQ